MQTNDTWATGWRPQAASATPPGVCLPTILDSAAVGRSLQSLGSALGSLQSEVLALPAPNKSLLE